MQTKKKEQKKKQQQQHQFQHSRFGEGFLEYLQTGRVFFGLFIYLFISFFL